LIIVGDIDVDAIEARIKNVFADIKAPVNPAPRLRYKVNDNETPIVAIASDPEATNYNITLSYKHDIVPDKEKGDLTYWLKGYIDRLVATMYNKHLEESAQKAIPSFIIGQGCYGNFFVSDTKDAWTTKACVRDKNGIDKAMSAIIAENNRMKQYGFTNAEIERAKSDLLIGVAVQVEIQHHNRNSNESKDYGAACLAYFLDKEPMMGIENEYMLLAQILPNLPMEAINAYVKELVREDNIVITVTGPQKNGETMPTKQDILRILSSH
jgi:zinc protease